MTKKFIIGTIAITALLIGLVSFFTLKNSTTTKDTVIQGDLIIKAGEVRVIKIGTHLNVTGDFNVLGVLQCEDDGDGANGISISVGGTMSVSGKIECLPFVASDQTNAPLLRIIARHISFSKEAEVAVNGSIDISSEESLLLSTPEAITQYLSDIVNDSGSKTHVGPFKIDKPTQALSPDSGYPMEKSNGEAKISGTWKFVNSSPQETNEQKQDNNRDQQFFRIDMGNKGNVVLEQLILEGSDGALGTEDTGEFCDAKGGAGGNGLLFGIHALTIIEQGASIHLGNGGDGGNAETSKNCLIGKATGGNGGQPGNMKWNAEESISFSNLIITSGKGGNGGNATAYGKNGDQECPGGAGGDTLAVGGKGGESGYSLSATGNITGENTIRTTRVIGGEGGNANAFPGSGGDGKECGCAGGNGGNGKASPGDGGSASFALFTQTGEAHGGSAGKSNVLGGDGGNGGTCSTITKGGDGGNGGNAEANEASGGKGTTAPGNNGSSENEFGGKGGFGGDGCPSGKAGIGGLGAPLGARGVDGKSLCVGEAKSLPVDTSVTLISAILYHGSYLPKDQLTISHATGCSEDHWRTLRGNVKATDGKLFQEPVISPCGFGKLSETPVVRTPERVKEIGTGLDKTQ